MPDAGCDELSAVGIYHHRKPGQVNDATDDSPWKLRPRAGPSPSESTNPAHAGIPRILPTVHRSRPRYWRKLDGW